MSKAKIPEPLSLHKFDMISALGKGAFGVVKLIKVKKTKNYFALKFIDKKQCITENCTRHIYKERQLLQTLSHPFLAKLYYAFQDDENLFMVLNVALGGDLRYCMFQKPVFTDYAVRIIAAEVCSGLGYMHQQFLVHRDIKPDNLLFDEDGHIIITDFNLVTSVKKKKSTSKSGTLNYMAPEMLQEQPYSYGVDWFATGVTLFEVIFYDLPFGHHLGGKEGIEQLLKTPLVFPKNDHTKHPHPLGADAINFFTQCLERNQDNRIGAKFDKDGFDLEVKKHPFFASIDWDLLYQKKIKPGYKPVTHKGKSNVTPDVLIGEMLGDEKQLEYKPRRKNKDPNHHSFGSRIKKLLGRSNSSDKPPKKKTKMELELEEMDRVYVDYDYELPDQPEFIMPEEERRKSLLPILDGPESKAEPRVASSLPAEFDAPNNAMTSSPLAAMSASILPSDTDIFHTGPTAL